MQFWSGRRVCVTGGNGFLGFHLVRLLRDLGARVSIFSLPMPATHPLASMRDVESHFGDLLDADAVQRAVAPAEIVFHTAGPVAAWGPRLATMHSVHRDGTRNVIRSCGPRTRLIHTSSIVAIGAAPLGRAARPLDEDAPFNLEGLAVDYVHAKRASEEIALESARSGRDTVVVNPAYLIGPYDFEPSPLGRLCVRIWKGNLWAAAPGGINLVSVHDAALGHLLAAEHGQAGRRYILGGENLSITELIRTIADVAGFRPRAIPAIPGPLLSLGASISEWQAGRSKRRPFLSIQQVRMNRLNWFVCANRAIRELGYSPRPTREAIQSTYDWYISRRSFSCVGLKRWWLRARSAA